MDNKLTVLVIEPEKEPYVKDIEPGLASLQRAVGGYIEAIYPFEDPVAIICDEEGKLKGKTLNRALRDEDGTIYDIVAGTFLVAGLGEEDFTSLTSGQLQKYAGKFETPERFALLGNKIVAVPVIPVERDNNKASLMDRLKEKEKTLPDKGDFGKEKRADHSL